MPFWYAATLVALIAVAVITSGQWPVTAAAVVLAMVVLLTVTVLVPINNRIGAWTGAADVDRDLASRWDRLAHKPRATPKCHILAACCVQTRSLAVRFG